MSHEDATHAAAIRSLSLLPGAQLPAAAAVPAGLPVCTHTVLLYSRAGLAQASIHAHGRADPCLPELPSCPLLKAALSCAHLLAQCQEWLWLSDKGSKGAAGGEPKDIYRWHPHPGGRSVFSLTR